MMSDREEALKALEKVDPEPGVPVTDKQMTEYEQACAVFVILNYETIRAALSEPEWRDISTAPRDGGPILISNGKWISKAYWSESCQFERFEEKAGWQIYQCEDGFYSVGAEPEEPTHWMPLPSPPKGKTP